MTILTAFDRRTAILTYLQQHRRASTRQLSDQFGVSEVTIRADLATLEKGGHLNRQHGGAELPKPEQGEQPFDLRRSQHPNQKIEVARAAAATIEPGDTILLDASSTAFQLALMLKNHRNLTVATNNVQTALALAGNPSLEIILIGGLVRGDNWSVVGGLAEEMLGKLHATRGFFGAAGLTLDRGLTDADSREVQIKRAMIAATNQVTVLLDASKFGQQSFLTFAHLADIDHLITDAIPEAYREACRLNEVSLTLVERLSQGSRHEPS